MVARSDRRLDAWHKSIGLAEAVYRLSAAFPSDERFGLTAQIRRAVVSVLANIAEGYGRTARGDYIQHLAIARGSLLEVETHLTLCVRLKLMRRSDAVSAWHFAEEVAAMLTSLIRSLQTDRINTRRATRGPRTSALP